MSHFHIVVWIDHRLARIYGLGQDEIATKTVETMDRETEGEVIAFAKKYFASSDRMTPKWD